MDKMDDFIKMLIGSGLNKVIFAHDPSFMVWISIPNLAFPVVNLSMTVSKGNTVIKAPKALSNPIVPFLAPSNSIFLCSMSIGL